MHDTEHIPIRKPTFNLGMVQPECVQGLCEVHGLFVHVLEVRKAISDDKF